MAKTRESTIAFKISGGFAIIDAEDLPKVEGRNWWMKPSRNTSYAVAYGDGERGAANVATRSKYGYRGIGFNPKGKVRPWQAMAKLDGKIHRFGWFDSKEAAALAHDIGIFGLRRDPALLNFPSLFAALTEGQDE